MHNRLSSFACNYMSMVHIYIYIYIYIYITILPPAINCRQASLDKWRTLEALSKLEIKREIERERGQDMATYLYLVCNCMSPGLYKEPLISPDYRLQLSSLPMPRGIPALWAWLAAPYRRVGRVSRVYGVCQGRGGRTRCRIIIIITFISGVKCQLALLSPEINKHRARTRAKCAVG